MNFESLLTAGPSLSMDVVASISLPKRKKLQLQRGLTNMEDATDHKYRLILGISTAHFSGFDWQIYASEIDYPGKDLDNDDGEICESVGEDSFIVVCGYGFRNYPGGYYETIINFFKELEGDINSSHSIDACYFINRLLLEKV